MLEALVGLLGVALGGVIGAVTTYLTTRSRMRLELEYGYDKELRNTRLVHYQRLFHISGRIPRQWLPEDEPTRDELGTIREEFHGWYFGTEAGGLFLTPAAKDTYMRLQNALEETAAVREPASAKLSAHEKTALYSLASNLRHQLTEDVGAAQPPRLPWARVGTTLPPPRASDVAASTVRSPT